MSPTQILVPLFLCVFTGIAYGRWRKQKPDPLVSAVFDVFMPALVFDALVTADVSLTDMAATGLASFLIVLMLFGLCLLVRPCLPDRQAWPVRAFSLPVLFMNAGFLGIPLMNLAFGSAAVGRMVVFDQVQSFMMFSLGIWIAAPRSSPSVIRGALRAFFGEPLIYAILAGVGCRLIGFAVPESLLRPIRFLGSATPALALFALGLRLSATPLAFLRDGFVLKRIVVILILRFAGGLACGWVAASVLSLEGVTRTVVMVASGLPSAVFSYILAERYNAEPDLAAAAVFSSTILSIPLLPVLLGIG